METEKPRLSLAHYLPELMRIKEAGGRFILVAGQAVNFWANRYRTASHEILKYQPFVSKDLDLFGTLDDLYILPKVLKGDLKHYRDLRTPVMGIFTTNSDPQLLFELLRGVYGPVSTEKIHSRAKSVEGISIIDPLSLLVSKVHNVAGIDQSERQDARHVKMMVLVTQAYFSELCDSVGDRITARQFIKECKYLLDFAKDSTFKKGLKLAESKLADCFPSEKIRTIGNEEGAIARFAENTLAEHLTV